MSRRFPEKTAMALSTELQEALARSRRQPRLRSRSAQEQAGAGAPLLQKHNDTVPSDDPDDRIDPDDSALPALPAPMPSEMPANWWETLLFGKPEIGRASLGKECRSRW